VHEVAKSPAEKKPAPHALQLLSTLYSPGRQRTSWHEAEPSAEEKPVAQAEQAVEAGAVE